MRMNDFIWPIRVYYEDTDAGGIVHHANYVKFLERSRVEWLRQHGIELTQLKQQYNLIFVIRQLTLDYLKPAFLDDMLHITVNLSKLGKASMTITQQVLRGADILCTATVKIARVNSANKRPQAIPPELLKILTNPS
ncbi:4-hydroxybenzoyl-CoA thioesterase [Beggiatoa sp. SS]|nr:4-hydroxybenzoyl-CoA thioesterase [Beggiatoa sp. SS]